MLISGEIAIRTYHYFKYGGKSVGTITLDNDLGWRTTENVKFVQKKMDAGGNRYLIEYKTNKDGFRLFGNLKNNKKRKVMFVGDSFTHAVQVSNNKTYYGILGDALPIEVFAYGGGGYGTLQEFMIINKWLDVVKPDMVILQYCSNDFINNHFELELRSNRNNNGMRRPYLTNRDKIVYAIPKHSIQRNIRDIACKYFRFLYFVISRIDRLFYGKKKSGSVEDIIESKGREFPLFIESIKKTEQLVRKIATRCSKANIEIYAFCVDNGHPYYEELQRISNKNNIKFIDGIPEAIQVAEQNGVVVRAADKAHWNEKGHQIAAKVLKEYFHNKFFFRKAR